jgi:hypothetical protein
MKMETQSREIVIFTPGMATKEKVWMILEYFRAFCGDS